MERMNPSSLDGAVGYVPIALKRGQPKIERWTAETVVGRYD
jgi:hypothetical protein